MPDTSPTRADVLLAAATLGLVAVAVAADRPSPGGAALAVVVGAVLGGLVLCARRWPLPALVATAVVILGYYALDLPPVGVAAPAAAVLYRVSERGRVVPAAVVAGSLLAVSVVARLAEGDDIAVVVGTELGSEAALLLAVIALGDAVRNRRSLRAALVRQAVAADEERHREAARQVEAERLRIAREVHDTLGHTMSVITLQSAVAREALADSDPAQAESALAAIRSVSGSAMAELRATLGTLRREPGPREPAPGFDRLPALVDGVRRGGLAVDLRIEGPVDTLPAVVGSTVYRVVQEALTNVLRHADATRVTVTVRATPGRLALEVVDDGRGSPPGGPTSGKGQGLRGMAERVALLGGTVETGTILTGSTGATAATGTGGTAGFRVSVYLPLTGVAA
ncbi:sensor histidine kinase [Micromonospora aurantiaca (nom. illeg.)]|uniref:histidine kinase n=1 Tax=Micromonospora aurantiaca (nom. illeg.) TaxID=47850 RepID=A0A6N3K0V5_9ACTN|nr:sensor histidine kinase [Micromonospora aurantiaca]AXH90833.1 sensor histidine kinase [Micromonospora aurantiaca]MBC9004924.1 sensor histidine kinase [Micromonospora aurantiaca]